MLFNINETKQNKRKKVILKIKKIDIIIYYNLSFLVDIIIYMNESNAEKIAICFFGLGFSVRYIKYIKNKYN